MKVMDGDLVGWLAMDSMVDMGIICSTVVHRAGTRMDLGYLHGTHIICQIKLVVGGLSTWVYPYIISNWHLPK